MAGKHEGFQLLEFQPKTVYLPENNNGTTGTFRRPGSAEERGDLGRNSPHYPRETEYARIPRRSYNEYDGTGPRERIIPLHEAHPVDGMKQPLLTNNNAPVYLLVPADSANLGPQGRYASGDERFYGGTGMMDGRGIRRKPTYVHERVDVDSYRREKSCCSCWKCMIALIVILTIIGLGLAITGIVFIKLIHQDNQPTAVNGTEVRYVPSQRSALADGPLSFDMTSVRNDSDRLASLGNESGNGTAADIAIVNGVGTDITTTQPANMTGVHLLEVPVSGNITQLKITLEHTTAQDSDAVSDEEIHPLVAQVYGEYREDPDDVHPVVARVYGVNNSAFNDDLETTTTVPVSVFVAPMAIAFHHTPSPDLGSSIQNLTQGIVRNVNEASQRRLEEVQRAGQRAMDNVKVDIFTASGTTSTMIPSTSP